MNQAKVKAEFGDKITICTGLSVQRTLPFGTFQDIRREVVDSISVLGTGGGLIYGTSHMAMSEVPVENIIALYETASKCGKYPLTAQKDR